MNLPLVLRKRYREKLEMIADLESALEVSRQAREHWETQAREYRKKYELLQLTPEVKADTEAAFIRGRDHFKQQLIGYLMAS